MLQTILAVVLLIALGLIVLFGVILVICAALPIALEGFNDAVEEIERMKKRRKRKKGGVE